MITLGLIKENKQPADRRVALTPTQCLAILSLYKNCDILVESSTDRVFSDAAYTNQGIKVTQDLSSCDILLGIKEVPINDLIKDKTYLFFSHTIKKQDYNRGLLQAMIEKNIRFIDYECLVWHSGARILGFGRYAGLVGAYETLKAVGKKLNAFAIKPAYECANYSEMVKVLKHIAPDLKNNNHKIVITGSGRVSHGSAELLNEIGLKKVTPHAFLHASHSESVYTILDTHELYARIDGEPWNDEHFHHNHSLYKSIFKPYTTVADIVINGVFWDKAIPPHFSKEDTKSSDFSIKVIGDISCDIEGSIPITLKDTHADNPVFGWDAQRQSECEPFVKNSIDVMAVSNLPTELPSDASEGFGDELIKSIIPELINPKSDIIKNATLCENGHLTEKFQYLSDYVFPH